MQFGIIGYGRFGKLWAQALLPFGTVLVYDKNPPQQLDQPQLQSATLQQAAQADVVFLLVPISEFERSCEQLKPCLKADSLLVDCCSVKVHPMTIMQKVFNKTQPLLGTHPLFGPDSVKRTGGMAGHKIVICPEQCPEPLQKIMLDIFSKMGLQILTSTPEQHDKDMANSQGLVHFIGRGLAALDLQPQAIATPDFQALLNINNMVVNDTWRLFLDMHQYNAYAKNVRTKFIHQLTKLEQAIEHADS